MKNKYLKISTLIFLILISLNSFAQEVTFSASWISAEDIELKEHNVIHLRKTFELNEFPESFTVKISADNQYRLFVNGEYVCKGPGRSDLEHWYYQTIDLAKYLKAGKNVIASEVVNFGPTRGFSQLSHLTAFLISNFSLLQKMPKCFQWKYHSECYVPEQQCTRHFHQIYQFFAESLFVFHRAIY